MIKAWVAIIGTAVLTLAASQPGFTATPIPVFVSIPPQKYFVQQIGKDRVDIHVMVEPGADPHTYEPKPRQLVALARAKLYFTIGIEFETAKLDKILANAPNIRVVAGDRGISKFTMEGHEKGTHAQSHTPSADNHAHDAHRPDPHIWLAPPLVKIQARTILEALQAVDPTHRADYEANYRVFIKELETLDGELKTLFSQHQGLQFMVLHPSWGYFARSYGLAQLPIEVEGKNPKPAQLRKLIQHARKENIKVIFAQPQLSAKSAQLIAKEIEGQVALLDPLAENWMANLREAAEKFRAALEK